MLERDTIPISKIRIDGGTQLRVETDPAVVRDYAEALRQADATRRKTLFPPIRLVWEESSDTFWLVDGFHRLHAHKEAGLEEIEADIEDGDLTLAKLRACGANLDHGLRRSNETKRNVVREALGNALTVGWSNQRIAELCGVSAPFVASMREALGLTPEKVVGKNGKEYRLADKLTEAHVFACPSLAQVEEWQRQHRNKPIAEVLERYAKHLRSIEQVTGMAGLNFVLSYGLANAARKGPGIIHALALRIERFLDQNPDAAPHPSWEEALASASDDQVMQLARDPAITRDQRKRALLAWVQWQDYGATWPREEAATPALEARWDKVHAPPEARPAPPPLTVARVLAMSRGQLQEVAGRWELRERLELREAAVTAAASVAPDLVVTCPDPCCGARWLTNDYAWCPMCREQLRVIPSLVQQQAARTDLRRKVTGSPLHLVLEILARPTWGPDDEELFWNRVAAWKAEGCEGLPMEPRDKKDLDEEEPDDEEEGDDEPDDQDELDGDEDLDDEGEDAA